MNWLVKRKLTVLAVMLALSFPSAVHAGRFFNWWSSPPTPTIQDVIFDPVSTVRAGLTKIEVELGRVVSSTSTDFASVDTTAEVASEVITFEQIILTEGDLTVTIDIDPASLTANRFGSRFTSDAQISIDNGTDTTDITGRVVGRIAERNGTYHLSAVVVGTLQVNEGVGSGFVEALRVPMRGTADVPVAP